MSGLRVRHIPSFFKLTYSDLIIFEMTPGPGGEQPVFVASVQPQSDRFLSTGKMLLREYRRGRYNRAVPVRRPRTLVSPGSVAPGNDDRVFVPAHSSPMPYFSNTRLTCWYLVYGFTCPRLGWMFRYSPEFSRPF